LPHFRRDSGPKLTVTKTPTRFILASLAAVAVAAFFAVGTLQAQAPKAPDTAVLTGAPLGNVTLSHAAHTKEYGAKCENCHHASKPEKAMKGAQEKCTDCHTKAAEAPMKTKLQAAFHDPMAKKGTCVDCHQEAIAKGNKKAPSKCADCHKKA
jgi:hypothetical protein